MKVTIQRITVEKQWKLWFADGTESTVPLEVAPDMDAIKDMLRGHTVIALEARESIPTAGRQVGADVVD